MVILSDADTTSLSYWLNWSVLLCALWVLTPMVVAIFLIWRHDRKKHSEFGTEREEERAGILWNRVWSPCIKVIPISVLMVFRIMSFCLLIVAITFDITSHGVDIFYFYTQWTFMLVGIYFLFGSLLSVYGCYLHHKISNVADAYVGQDPECGTYIVLASENPENGKSLKTLAFKKNTQRPQFLVAACYMFEILFQMTAGAVMLTDVVYWCIMFPFLTIKNYEMSFLTVVAHSLNLVLLLGDVVLNSMTLPWHRISYFILWTGIYVIFQWTLHAFVPIWWPYPFLDLSAPFAPIWYLVVALMHLPCYGLFVLIVKFKEYMLARWFPHSYMCLR